MIFAVRSVLLNSMYIPRKICDEPLVMVIFPKVLSNWSIIMVTTSGSAWEILVSSTYQAMVHYLPFMSQFAMHRS